MQPELPHDGGANAPRDAVRRVRLAGERMPLAGEAAGAAQRRSRPSRVAPRTSVARVSGDRNSPPGSTSAIWEPQLRPCRR